MAKLTVEFSDQLNEVLDELAKKEQTSKTQVLRKAIALMKVVDNETNGAEGKERKLTIADANDNVVKEIVV
jgi:predicted transcriptional regulator